MIPTIAIVRIRRFPMLIPLFVAWLILLPFVLLLLPFFMITRRMRSLVAAGWQLLTGLRGTRIQIDDPELKLGITLY